MQDRTYTMSVDWQLSRVFTVKVSEGPTKVSELSMNGHTLHLWSPHGLQPGVAERLVSGFGFDFTSMSHRFLSL